VLNETYSTDFIGKYLTSYLSEWHKASFLFDSAMKYGIRRVQENQEGPKLNVTHHLLAFAYDINVMRENIDTIQRSTKAPLEATKVVGLEVNPEKLYMLMSHYQKAKQMHSIKIAKRSFQDVARFKYLGTTRENEVHWHRKRRNQRG
jgi:hypothetical protein